MKKLILLVTLILFGCTDYEACCKYSKFKEGDVVVFRDSGKKAIIIGTHNYSSGYHYDIWYETPQGRQSKWGVPEYVLQEEPK